LSLPLVYQFDRLPMTSKSSLKKIFDNSLIVLYGNFGASIFGLLSISILTHSMGVEIFGYYVLILSFIEIVDRMFNFQTWQAFVKYASDFLERGEKHYVIMLIKFSFLIDFLSLAIAFLVALVSINIVMIIFDIPSDYKSSMIFMSISLLFNMLNISIGVFRIFDEFMIQSKILVFAAFVKFILFGLIAVVSPSFELFIISIVFSKALEFVLTLMYLVKVLDKNEIRVPCIAKTKINLSLMKEIKIIRFIVYNNFDVAVRMVSRQLDVILLGKMYGAETVGIYRIAKELANIIGKLTDPIYQAIYPEFAKLLASNNNNKEKVKGAAVKISFYAGLSGVVFYVLFSVFGEYAIRLAFGEEFVAAYDITLVYLGAVFVAIITLPLYPMQHALGFAKEAFTNQLHATIVYFPILVILTFQFDMIGAAISYVIYYIYITRLTLKSVQKGFN